MTEHKTCDTVIIHISTEYTLVNDLPLQGRPRVCGGELLRKSYASGVIHHITPPVTLLDLPGHTYALSGWVTFEASETNPGALNVMAAEELLNWRGALKLTRQLKEIDWPPTVKFFGDARSIKDFQDGFFLAFANELIATPPTFYREAEVTND